MILCHIYICSFNQRTTTKNCLHHIIPSLLFTRSHFRYWFLEFFLCFRFVALFCPICLPFVDLYAALHYSISGLGGWVPLAYAPSKCSLQFVHQPISSIWRPGIYTPKWHNHASFWCSTYIYDQWRASAWEWSLSCQSSSLGKHTCTRWPNAPQINQYILYFDVDIISQFWERKNLINDKTHIDINTSFN